MYCCVLRVIEPDQQIRAYTHQLPEQIHLENIGSHHESEHGHRKKRQVSIETLETVLILLKLIVLVTFSHITERIDVNHEADSSNDDQHHHTDRRKAKTNIKGQQLCKLQPGEVESRNSRVHTTCQTAVSHVESLAHGSVLARIEEIAVSRVEAENKQRAHHAGTDDAGHLARHLHSEQSKHNSTQEREKKYQKCVIKHICFLFIISYFQYCSPDRCGNDGKH